MFMPKTFKHFGRRGGQAPDSGPGKDVVASLMLSNRWVFLKNQTSGEGGAELWWGFGQELPAGGLPEVFLEDSSLFLS